MNWAYYLECIRKQRNSKRHKGNMEELAKKGDKAFFEFFSHSEFEVFTKLNTMAKIRAEMDLPKNQEIETVSQVYSGYCHREDTHCKEGHELTPDNVFRTKSGKVCRICRRLYYKLIPHNIPRSTHCHRGHKFTPNSTYINRRGGRECKICKSIGRRAKSRKIA